MEQQFPLIELLNFSPIVLIQTVFYLFFTVLYPWCFDLNPTLLNSNNNNNI